MFMRNMNIESISMMACRTSPPPSWRAAPPVSADMPDTIAAS
jgi:hypothetical protein